MFAVARAHILNLAGDLSASHGRVDIGKGSCEDAPAKRVVKGGTGGKAHRPRRGWVMVFSVCAILVTALSGCTSGHTSPSQEPTVAQVPSSQDVSPNANPKDVFEGKQPASAAEWWQRHPDVAPPWVVDNTLLLSEQGKGKESFTVDRAAQYGTLTMVLTCARASNYRIELGSIRSPVLAWTAGESCGGPGINSYETPPLDPKNLPDRVTVDVSSDTEYFIVLYGKPKK